MPPTNPPLPFCTLGDIQQYLSIEGVQLSIVDNPQGTGQYLWSTTAAALGATSVNVQPLDQVVQSGAQLEWGGADMPQTVECTVTAVAGRGATAITVVPLPAAVPAGAVAVDGGVNQVQLALVNTAIYWATSQVRMYTQSRYYSTANTNMDQLLQQSWTVNRWTTVAAARWIRKRKGQPVPSSIEGDFKEAKSEMMQVASGTMYIEDLGLGQADWPAWSNTVVRPEYWLAKSRVQRAISEQASGAPVGYGQNTDWISDNLWEP